MTKSLLLTTGLLLSTTLLFGQGAASDYADDAFRFSDASLNGTARFRGLGGNHAALGGDASNLFGNPAGLGFYNRSELSISPSLNLVSNQNNFLGAQTVGSNSKASIGQFSLVLAGGDKNNNQRWRRSSFGISYAQTANFYDYIDARGTNNNQNSSIVQSYINAANDAKYSEAQLSDGFIPGERRADFREAAAYGLFLINPTVYNANSAGPPYTRFDANTPKDQRATLTRSGAQSQWSLAYAGNLDDKLYIGGSVSFTRLRYASEFNFVETPLGGRTFNNYGQINRFNVAGNGISASLGIIYKLSPELQVGATIISPTISSARETFTQTLTASAKDPNLQLKANAVDVITPYDNFDYTLQTPLRASGGATFFIGKAGFLTATAEYVGYSGMRVRTSYFNTTQDNTDFKNDVKQSVMSSYQNVVNLRLGGEVRAGLLRLRAGVGYLPSAYKLDLDRVAKADRDKLLLSAGVGVRNQRFFADLSGSYLTTKSGISPYQLPNDADTPTVLTNNRNTNLTLSIGTFF
ncbi:outer membrane protein transport protein [Spirosoma luteolum]